MAQHKWDTKEAIAFLINQTGWSLEYIGSLSITKFYALVNELAYHKTLDEYKEAYNFFSLLATWCSDRTHRYRAEDFIGQPPWRLKEVKTTLTITREPTRLTLGDGNEYQFTPVNVNIMEQLEEEFDKPWDELLTKMKAKVLKSLMFYLLKPNHPDITKEKVGELLTAQILTKIYQSIVK